MNNGASYAYNFDPGTWTATALDSTVPEPGSIALLTTVVAGVGCAVRKKRSSRPPAEPYAI